MAREILINHSDIRDPQKITNVIESRFKDQGLNCRVNEVEKIVDCHRTGKRMISVKNTRYFFQGGH